MNTHYLKLSLFYRERGVYIKWLQNGVSLIKESHCKIDSDDDMPGIFHAINHIPLQY